MQTLCDMTFHIWEYSDENRKRRCNHCDLEQKYEHPQHQFPIWVDVEPEEDHNYE